MHISVQFAFKAMFSIQQDIVYKHAKIEVISKLLMILHTKLTEWIVYLVVTIVLNVHLEYVLFALTDHFINKATVLFNAVMDFI